MNQFGGLILIFTIALLSSCEKENFFKQDETQEIDAAIVREEVTGGQPIKIGTDDYIHYTLPSHINKILIEDGNGIFHVSPNRENSISIPGYWIGESSCNSLEIMGNTLVVKKSFSDTYIYLSDLEGIEIQYGNSTMEIDKHYATGEMNIDLHHNSTLTFMENSGEIEVVNAPDFDPIVRIRGNGKFLAYGVKMRSIRAVIESNGKIFVNAENSINIEFLENGSLYYKGNPTIDVTHSFNSSLIDDN